MSTGSAGLRTRPCISTGGWGGRAARGSRLRVLSKSIRLNRDRILAAVDPLSSLSQESQRQPDLIRVLLLVFSVAEFAPLSQFHARPAIWVVGFAGEAEVEPEEPLLRCHKEPKISFITTCREQVRKHGTRWIKPLVTDELSQSPPRGRFA